MLYYIYGTLDRHRELGRYFAYRTTKATLLAAMDGGVHGGGDAGVDGGGYDGEGLVTD